MRDEAVPTMHHVVTTPRSIDRLRGRSFAHYVRTAAFVENLQASLQAKMLAAVLPCLRCPYCTDELGELLRELQATALTEAQAQQ